MVNLGLAGEVAGAEPVSSCRLLRRAFDFAVSLEADDRARRADWGPPGAALSGSSASSSASTASPPSEVRPSSKSSARLLGAELGELECECESAGPRLVA